MKNIISQITMEELVGVKKALLSLVTLWLHSWMEKISKHYKEILLVSNLDNAQEKPPKHFVERLSKQVIESTRDNISYLNRTVRQPVVYALKGLRGSSY